MGLCNKSLGIRLMLWEAPVYGLVAKDRSYISHKWLY
jgi:hypothetical protein